MLNVKFAYAVIYDDEVVGYVASATDATAVESEVLSNIKIKNAENFVGDTTSKLAITLGSKISAADEVADSILESEHALLPVSTLVVDGEAVLSVYDGEALNNLVTEALNRFNVGGEEEVSFVKNITVEQGFCPRSQMASLVDARFYLERTEVKTVRTLTYTEEIPFETVRTESSSYLKGYVRVTSAGVKGSADVTAKITTVNGVETGRDILNTVTLSEPVAQKEVVGTAAIAKTSNTQYASGNAMFCWPLQKVSRQKITSYWGDGRNHKAIDIASPTGTPIYAGLGGTVTYAGYRSDYGYHVIIDHGNGYSTLYAHASKLNVSVGQVVAKGETIALVGSTGQSTGSHLHFEVRINGTRVNPIGYIAK